MQAKANDMDVDGKRDEIALIQEVVERHFSKGARVQKIFDDGGVLVHVQSSALASEVRLRSEQMLTQVRSALKEREISRIVTKVV